MPCAFLGLCPTLLPARCLASYQDTGLLQPAENWGPTLSRLYRGRCCVSRASQPACPLDLHDSLVRYSRKAQSWFKRDETESRARTESPGDSQLVSGLEADVKPAALWLSPSNKHLTGNTLPPNQRSGPAAQSEEDMEALFPLCKDLLFFKLEIRLCFAAQTPCTWLMRKCFWCHILGGIWQLVNEKC